MKLRKNNLTDAGDGKIFDRFRHLKRHQPPAALWEKIETRLMAELDNLPVRVPAKKTACMPFSKISHYFRTAEAHWNRFRIVLALTTLAGLIFLTTFFMPPQKPRGLATSEDQILAQLDKDLVQTERQYQTLITRLTGLAAQNEPNIEPHLLALYREKLMLLDESIRTCKKALQENYQNPAVQLALFESYREKVATLKIIAEAKFAPKTKVLS